jgi:hypothetical protein
MERIRNYESLVVLVSPDRGQYRAARQRGARAAGGRVRSRPVNSVPMTFIGEHVIVGFQSFEQTGLKLETLVNECLEQGCGDPLDRIADHPLAAAIKQQAADRQPEGWELFPATARSAPDTTSSQ